MTKQMELLGEIPVMGPAYADGAPWYAMRRQGITATEVAKLAKGYRSDWRRLLIEKVTEADTNITGNRYIDRGHEREPVIAAWIDFNYGIAPNDHVYSINGGRYLATPDGTGDPRGDHFGVCAEIKTSKNDLDPANPASTFEQTGYYDQMQFQMLVMGADSTLFVWEQHDNNWPDPTPIFEEPQARWIARDPDRIDYLIDLADRFLLELDAARTAGLPPVSEMPSNVAEWAHRLLQARDQEAVGKARKDEAWKALQAILLPEGDDTFSNEEATVTVSSITKPVVEFDEAAMREQEQEFLAAYDRIQAMYEAKRQFYTTTREVTTTGLHVTAKR